ncbi:MAG: DUF2332 domain-containing protein, partial [Acidimicrobiales bacterium]
MARDLADVWTHFADTSCGSYSPLYDQICRTVSDTPEVLDLVRDAPPKGHQPNVLLAAVHYLLLGGLAHPLASVYDGTSDADPSPLFVDVCLTNRAEIVALLATRHTNTNEVGRSAVIGPALTSVATHLSAPFALIDVGCSAGLNLLCDRYRLHYGAHGATGPAEAAVQIECVVRNGEPPIANRLPAIAERVGLDRHPVSTSDQDEVRWLLACVWPDTGRLPRTKLAIAEATKAPPRLVEGDAVGDIGRVLAAVDRDLTPVVVTSWALAYLAKPDRVAFRDALLAASADRPVAWISGEGYGFVDLFAS